MGVCMSLCGRECVGVCTSVLVMCVGVWHVWRCEGMRRCCMLGLESVKVLSLFYI